MSNSLAIANRVGLDTASPFQITIFEALEYRVQKMLAKESVERMIVRAVAGSGKTTTIVACMKLVPATMTAIFVAFNAVIAKELRSRLPQAVDARTLNSLGHRIWGRFVQQRDGVQPEFNENKVTKLIRDVLDNDPLVADLMLQHGIGKYQTQKVFGADIRFFVNRARSVGLVPNGANDAVSVAGVEDTMETWNGFVEKFSHVVTAPCSLEDLITLVRKVLLADLRQDRMIDYDDQLYFPAVKRLSNGSPIPCFKHDVVVVDEAQDLNPVQRVLLHMSLKPAGMLIAVGDPNQAIYGFRGADTESMDRIQSEFNCEQFPLSICYRSGRKIVEMAQTVNPEIQPSPNAIEGVVAKLDTFNAETFKLGDLIISRNNAPTITLAYKLLRARRPVKVLGRDIGAGLIRVIDRLPHEDNPVLLAETLVAWKDKQIGIVRAKNPDDEAGEQRIVDQYDSLMVFVTESASATVEGIKTEILNLFADDKDATGHAVIPTNRITLSTIHKVKGSEAARVFCLDTFLLHPYWIEKGSWQDVQETNLEYVMYTRAKAELYFINTKDYKAA